MEGRAQVPFNLWIGLSLKDRRSQSPSSFPRKPGSRGGRSPLLPAHGGALWAVCGPALRDLGCRKPPARRAPLFPLPSRQSCPQEPRLRATRSPGCGSHPCRFSRLGRSTYLSPSTAVGFLFLATNATFGKAFHELLNKDSRPEEALRPGERTRRSSLRAGGEHAQTGRLLCACAQSHRCLPGARCPAARTCLLKALHLGPWGKAKPLLKGSAVAQDSGPACPQPPRFGARSAPCQLASPGQVAAPLRAVSHLQTGSPDCACCPGPGGVSWVNTSKEHRRPPGKWSCSVTSHRLGRAGAMANPGDCWKCGDFKVLFMDDGN